jgi:hypothetical protein
MMTLIQTETVTVLKNKTNMCCAQAKNKIICEGTADTIQRSQADLLSLVTEVWLRSLDEYGESSVVSLDISKAFDRVWHKGLLHKLPAYGICGAALQWLSSYLSERKISVVLEGATNDKLSINAGFPQGSILGPALFLLYINDLPDKLRSGIHVHKVFLLVIGTLLWRVC